MAAPAPAVTVSAVPLVRPPVAHRARAVDGGLRQPTRTLVRPATAADLFFSARVCEPHRVGGVGGAAEGGSVRGGLTSRRRPLRTGRREPTRGSLEGHAVARNPLQRGPPRPPYSPPLPMTNSTFRGGRVSIPRVGRAGEWWCPQAAHCRGAEGGGRVFHSGTLLLRLSRPHARRRAVCFPRAPPPSLPSSTCRGRRGGDRRPSRRALVYLVGVAPCGCQREAGLLFASHTSGVDRRLPPPPIVLWSTLRWPRVRRRGRRDGRRSGPLVHLSDPFVPPVPYPSFRISPWPVTG